MFQLQIHQIHDDDENMHEKIYDKLGDILNLIYQPMPPLLISCN